MGPYELYLFKSILSVSLLYIFYLLFLRNETYYSWNRLFLLISLVISLILPVFNFSIGNIPSNTFGILLNPIDISSFGTTKAPVKIFDSLSILSVIYISGAVFFCLRFLSSLAKIFSLYCRFPKCRYNGFKAVILDSDQSPFTFFNILFISGTDYESGKINEMIIHERAHKEEHHSLDVALMEIMTIIQWFNPFIWLFRHSLQSEHEFIADNKVLLEGIDKVKYQKLLFERSLGITSFNLTNNFNYSLLKKRLKMMTIKKSSSLVKIKYVLSMPVLIATMMLLVNNFNSYGQEDKVYTDVDVMAKYKNGSMDDVARFIMQNITYPQSAKDNNITAKIYVQFVVDEKGKVKNVQIVRSKIKDNLGNEIVVEGYKSKTTTNINPKAVSDLEAEAIRVIKLLDDFTPAQKDGKNVKTQFTYPIAFTLKDSNK